MQTTTAPKAGNAPDLLQGILSVHRRNLTQDSCRQSQDRYRKRAG